MVRKATQYLLDSIFSEGLHKTSITDRMGPRQVVWQPVVEWMQSDERARFLPASHISLVQLLRVSNVRVCVCALVRDHFPPIVLMARSFMQRPGCGAHVSQFEWTAAVPTHACASSRALWQAPFFPAAPARRPPAAESNGPV